ncbi:hypothetical protein [Phenylobacterium sp.]|nr:hypothetical protein [Phenylobacterium sp.]
MSDFAANLALVVAALIVGLFCAGFAAAQIVAPQTLIAGFLS